MTVFNAAIFRLQVIRNHLSGAVIGTECMVEFEGDHISLDIPNDGVVKEGWSIIPLAAPVVSKLAPVTVAYLIAEHIHTGSWTLDYCTGHL